MEQSDQYILSNLQLLAWSNSDGTGTNLTLKKGTDYTVDNLLTLGSPSEVYKFRINIKKTLNLSSGRWKSIRFYITVK